MRRTTCIVAATALCTLAVPIAHADESLSDLDQQVKESAAAYNEAVAEQERLAGEIEQLDGKIARLDEELPRQQARSDDSYRALYKYQSDRGSMFMMLLDADSISEAIALIDSYNWIIEYNTSEIAKTARMQQELKDSREQLEQDKGDADATAAEAASALESAKAARQRAQEAALAAQRAEREAAAQEAASAQQSASSTAEKKAVQEQDDADAQDSENSSASHVDWDSDKAAFVDKWAPRIDDYLAGSPTAGTGETYAAAAWDNGVDPRWAPAISCIESSKGAACFASYNAWGYGHSGFASWADGINTVVGALGGSLYGGYLTKQAAKTYCPPTWQDWYSKVSAEMSSI